MPLSIKLTYLYLDWHFHNAMPSRYASLLTFLNAWMWDGKDMGCFPSMHADLLLSWTKHEERQVRAVAWSGVVLMVLRYGNRLPKEFVDQVCALAQNDVLKAELEEVQKFFFTSIIGLKSRNKIQDEIFTKMHREQENIRKKLGLAADDEERSELAEEGNKKMMEYVGKLNRLAQDGIDMNLATFASLKGLDIFKELDGWLIDFDINNPMLDDLGENRQLANAIFGHAELCDLDKYALSAAVNKITSIEAMKQQLPQQLHDVDSEEFVRMRKMERDNNAYRYAFQTMVRFFMFSPWSGETFNPFQMDPFLTGYSALIPFINDDFLLNCSRLFLRHSHYIQAAAHLRSWMHRNGHTEETLRMLAECDRNLGDNAERLQCLMELEKMNGDDLQLVQETGLCLLEEKRYDEALQRFFHLEVKETNVRSSARAIAWCSLMTKNLKRADRYYKKLLNWQGGPSWEDLLNAGHCAWMNGEAVEASQLYGRYLKMQQDNLEAFDNDRDVLLALGIGENDINLMRETIAM